MSHPDDARIRFLARAQEPNRWGGEAPLPELDVEGALASVLARARAGEAPAPFVPRGEPGDRLQAASPRSGRRWTRFLAAALLMVGGAAPLLVSHQGEGQRDARVDGAGILAGVSTSAVVYSENSGSQRS